MNAHAIYKHRIIYTPSINHMSFMIYMWYTGNLTRGVPHRLWGPQRASAREAASDRHRPYAGTDGLRWQRDGGH